MILFGIFIVIIIVVITLIVYGALIVSSRQERTHQYSRKSSKAGEISGVLKGEDEFEPH